MNVAGNKPAQPASVRFRVHSLQLPSVTSPLAAASNSVTGPFRADGLYVVLRLENQVHRTTCLWDSFSEDEVALLEQASAAQEEEGEEGDSNHGGELMDRQQQLWSKRQALALTWNEVFDFSLCPPDGLASADLKTTEGDYFSNSARMASGSVGVLPSVGRFSSQPDTPPSAPTRDSPARSGSATPTALSQQSTPNAARAKSGLPFPTIDIELWRSTRSAEHCLARYAFCVPFELLSAKEPSSPATGASGVVDRVLPLQSASSYDQRLSLRVRVRATGLTLRTTTPSATAAGGGGMALPYGAIPSASPLPVSTAASTAMGYLTSSASPLPVLGYAAGPSVPPSMMYSAMMGGYPFPMAGMMGGLNAAPNAMYPAATAALDPRLACLLSPLGLQQQAVLAHAGSYHAASAYPGASSGMPAVLPSPLPSASSSEKEEGRRPATTGPGEERCGGGSSGMGIGFTASFQSGGGGGSAVLSSSSSAFLAPVLPSPLAERPFAREAAPHKGPVGSGGGGGRRNQKRKRGGEHDGEGNSGAFVAPPPQQQQKREAK